MEKIYIKELWSFRELLSALTIREIKVRYKQTLLGAAWAILQPASLTIIFTIVFGIFLKVSSGALPYPIFAYSALLPWTFFSNAVTFGALSVVNNGSLVSKIYFPREVLPISSVGAALFDFAMAAMVFIIMIAFYKVSLTSNIVYLFIIIPSILFLTTGISMILATLNVLFRDIKFVVPLALQIWLYISPVIYSFDQVPEKYKVFIFLNPLTGLIQSFRDASVYGKEPPVLILSYSVILSIIIFLLGYWFFKSKERIFADVL